MDRLKLFFKRIIRSLGFEITKVRKTRTTLYSSVRHLKTIGYLPSVIIDAGVASGTPGIYENYPNVKTLLIEPLSEFEPKINKLLKKYRHFIYVPKALSSKTELKDIYVKKSTSGSSFFINKEEKIIDKRKIPCVSLNNILKEFGNKKSIMLKLDIEGGEKDVIESTQDLNKFVDVIIIELTFRPKLDGAPSFSDLFLLLDKKGYEIFDIVDIRYDKTNRNLFQADVVFVHKSSSLSCKRRI